MQTIIAKGPVKILHINKENLARLLKLATLAGPATSDTTLTAMTEVAFETWVNRIEKFATPNDDFSCLDQMVRDLSKHPTMRQVLNVDNVSLKLNNLGHACYLIIKNIDFKIMPNHRSKFEFQIEADRSRDFYKRRSAIPFVVQSLRQKPSTLNTTLCERWIFIQVQFL